VKPVDFILGGVVVAGLAGGIATGALSSSAASELEGGLHDRATVDALEARRRTLAIASIGSYAVAGAAALAEVAMIVFLERGALGERRPLPGRRVRIAHASFLSRGSRGEIRRCDRRRR
jgi:hypothetical protein